MPFLTFLSFLNLKTIWPLIKKFWPYILVAAIAIGGYLYWNSLVNKIEKLEQDNATLQLQLQTCNANFNGLKGSLDAQNEALKKIDKMVEQNQQEWKKLYSNIKGQNAALDKRLQDILKEKKPESCQAAIKYLLEARKGYTK
jgi:Tfp pilus assembly protein PilO